MHTRRSFIRFFTLALSAIVLTDSGPALAQPSPERRPTNSGGGPDNPRPPSAPARPPYRPGRRPPAPPPRLENRPHPRRGFRWQAGRWVWSARTGRWVWIPGRWMPAK
ncbi:YXWGXW repeat-containing protein [Agrobacterium pusense]|uniref:YXWGXW repeat-containing protein n=1 Tax=Agrobacterium pusense TaxID=648995 RepID=UPI002452A092|nr:YXWGXW repeat-containing protein [Agrobacterium pusense]